MSQQETSRIKFLQGALVRIDNNIESIKNSQEYTPRQKKMMLDVYEEQRSEYFDELYFLKRGRFEGKLQPCPLNQIH